MTYLQHFEPLYQSHAKLLLNTSELPSTTSLWVQDVAIYGLCVALWQSVGAAIRQGRIYIPISMLERYQVTASSLFDCEVSEPFLRLARTVSRFLQYKAYQTNRLWTSLPKQTRSSLKPLHRLHLIHQATFQAIANDGHRVLHHRIALGPYQPYLRVYLQTLLV
jgi:phytoene/squalene synthetase